MISRNLVKKPSRGFTLIEILVVIGIIAILAAIVIIAINPAKQFAQARNTQRQANVNAILNAIGQRIADNKGTFAGQFTVDGTTYYCGKIPTTAPFGVLSDSETSLPAGESQKYGCLVPTYISALPVDPAGPNGSDTNYTASTTATGRVQVCAPKAKDETAIPDAGVICVTR